MLKEKLRIFLINTLLFKVPLLALTHPQMELQRNEHTCCAWAGGTFFPVVLLCQFFGSGGTLAVCGQEKLFSSCAIVSVFCVVGNRFRCYLPTIPLVPLCLVAQVSFLVVVGKRFRCNLLTDHTSCAVVSVFYFRRKIIFGCTVSKKDFYLVSLRERGSIYLSLYHLTVTIISQKYQELYLQVEISK
jgi:hypothetical protein